MLMRFSASQYVLSHRVARVQGIAGVKGNGAFSQGDFENFLTLFPLSTWSSLTRTEVGIKCSFHVFDGRHVNDIARPLESTTFYQSLIAGKISLSEANNIGLQVD